ncbi:MAG: hypothetical protein GY913_11080 [Proteobacteria bacterium]|nr:hypothetical protein [Pseudomonadota bacterium]
MITPDSELLDTGDSAVVCEEGTACDDGNLCTTDDACDADGVCVGAAVDCDDGSACTTDWCDELDGSCENETFSGVVDELYDLELLGDPDTLAIEIVDTDTVWIGDEFVEVSEVEFTSYQSHKCEISEVRLEAFIAQGETSARGLVLVQDLDDPRDSWLWEHTAATVRAVTPFDTWPGVDRERIGVSGIGYGGVAALGASAVDERISVSVPVDASAHFEYAEAANARQIDWLESLGKSWDSSVWVRFDRYLDPADALSNTSAATLLVSSPADPYFPLDGVAATLEGLSDARLLSDDARNVWAKGRWERDFTVYEVPPMPVLAGGAIDLGEHGYDVASVVATWSGDGFETEESRDVSDLSWSVPEGSAGFVTVTYEGVTGQQFSLSSAPSLPEGFEPFIE